MVARGTARHPRVPWIQGLLARSDRGEPHSARRLGTRRGSGRWTRPAAGARRVAGDRAARPRRSPQRDGADHCRAVRRPRRPARVDRRDCRGPRADREPSRTGRPPGDDRPQGPRRGVRGACGGDRADAVRDPARPAEPSRAAAVRGAPVGAAGEGWPDHGRRAGRGGDAGRAPGDGRVDAGGGADAHDPDRRRRAGDRRDRGRRAGRACRWATRRGGLRPAGGGTGHRRLAGTDAVPAGRASAGAGRDPDGRRAPARRSVGQGRARQRRDRGQRAGRDALPRGTVRRRRRDRQRDPGGRDSLGRSLGGAPADRPSRKRDRRAAAAAAAGPTSR